MRPVPEDLRHRVFSRADAEAAGVGRGMLRGARFARVLPNVWRTSDHALTPDDWIEAARLALPASARTTGLTRIQQLGLDHGPRLPVRFVIAGDHHLAHDQVFLHRTVRMPPTDDVGVTPAAAYLAHCSIARTLDVVQVGDWLLRHGHVDPEAVRALALAEPWRAGAQEALWTLPHLDGRARSLPESAVRTVLGFSGLPSPEVNAPLDVGEDLVVIGDLLYRPWHTVVEYEGSHHQAERDQYVADLDRYAVLRAAGLRYVQVTKEHLARPRTLVGTVHRELVAAGYEGPPPEVGPSWAVLFEPLSRVVPRRPVRGRTASGD